MTNARRALPASATASLELAVPARVRGILARLHERGFEAYLVGGCVRDAIRKVEPKDWDIATSARPDETVATFSGAKITNDFGTVLVSDGAGGTLEVTTYRRDGTYSDHRRPDGVVFTDSLLIDLARRDFTMNAMAYADGQLVDPHGGMQDLLARRLVTVGAAHARFQEDALRMVRAARFAATLELDPASELVGAMRAQAPDLDHIARERILAELEKMLLAPRPSLGLRLLARTGALTRCLPGLARTAGVLQHKKANFDVLEHTLATIDAVPAAHPDVRVLRWAALCHDLGKPKAQQTHGPGVFHGHELVGERAAQEELHRLRMDEATVRIVSHLTRHHMFWFADEWTPAAVRRFITKVGLEHVQLLLELRRADVRGGGKQVRRFPALDELERRIRAEIDAQRAFSLRDLKIDGTVLMEELGLRPSPIIGRLLKALFDEVTEDPAMNDLDRLLARAHQIYKESEKEAA